MILEKKYEFLNYPKTNEDNEQFENIIKSSFNELRDYYIVKSNINTSGITTERVWTKIFVYYIGSPVGYCEVNESDGMLNVKSLCVIKENRKNGVMRNVMCYLQDKFKKNISLWCVEGTNNNSIFEKVGFKVVNVEESIFFLKKNGHPINEINLIKPYI